MDIAGSLALYARGKEAWNAWAEPMIARRRALAATGQWAVARDSREDEYPTNAATQSWQQEAAAQFNYHVFDHAPDFSGFVFPGACVFVATKFPEGACFRAARFLGGACFNYARFGAAADFENAEFCSRASFAPTDFADAVRFDHCRFIPSEFDPTDDGRIDCSEAKFAKAARFAGIRCETAVFSDTQFADSVSFEGASFSEMFFISGAVFRGPVIARGAQFPMAVDWSEATVSGGVEE
jgi:uncharacterized protein YjbI with pentapeptide repeats